MYTANMNGLVFCIYSFAHVTTYDKASYTQQTLMAFSRTLNIDGSRLYHIIRNIKGSLLLHEENNMVVVVDFELVLLQTYLHLPSYFAILSVDSGWTKNNVFILYVVMRRDIAL